MNALIAFHTAVAVYSVLVGVVVLRNRKGTVLHTRLGRSFVAAMIATDLTAFCFIPINGPSWFHLLAAFNLFYILIGLWHAYFRRSRLWQVHHYYFFAYAFLGVLAAACARLPLLFVPSMDLAAIIAIAAVFGIGSPLVERTGKQLRTRFA